MAQAVPAVGTFVLVQGAPVARTNRRTTSSVRRGRIAAETCALQIEAKRIVSLIGIRQLAILRSRPQRESSSTPFALAL